MGFVRRHKEFSIFLGEHRQLTNLNITHELFTDDEFNDFTEKLMKLERLTLRSKGNLFHRQTIAMPEVEEFVKRCDTLKRCDIINYPYAQKMQMIEKLEHQWHVYDISNPDGLSFIRRAKNQTLDA